MRSKYKLIDILSVNSVNNLKNMAKEFGLRGCSKLKKNELLNALCSYILEQASMEFKFLAATDKDIEQLETAMKQKVVIKPDTFFYRYWERLGFAYISINYEVMIPIEVDEEYLRIKENTRYQEARNRFLIIDFYALACTNLYSIIELDQLIQIINTQTVLCTDREEVVGWCLMRYMFRGCEMYFFRDGYVMSDFYGDNILGVKSDYHELLTLQKDKPYYVPEKTELIKYVDNIYIEENISFKNMLRFMKTRLKLSDVDAYDYSADIQLQIRNGAMPNAVVNECTRIGITFANQNQFEEFMQLLMVMFNNTRISENRGYTPEEIRKMMPEKDGISDEVMSKLKNLGAMGIAQGINDNVIPFAENKINQPKIYPNDPCPCGSGKKYKKCCGRNK
jgi:hypothetical protein